MLVLVIVLVPFDKNQNSVILGLEFFGIDNQSVECNWDYLQKGLGVVSVFVDVVLLGFCTTTGRHRRCPFLLHVSEKNCTFVVVLH